MEKVNVYVKIRLQMEVEDLTQIGELVDNMDYSFTLDDDDKNRATIVDTNMNDWEVA